MTSYIIKATFGECFTARIRTKSGSLIEGAVQIINEHSLTILDVHSQRQTIIESEGIAEITKL